MMMKKRVNIIVAMVVMLLAVGCWSGRAIAFPLSVSGSANPDSSSLTSIGGGLSTIDVEYNFRVFEDNGFGASMSFLTLEFENDVFTDGAILGIASPSSSWSNVGFFDGPTIHYEFFSGADGDIGLGDSLRINANVTIFDLALTDGSLWNEGGVWEQSFSGTSAPFGTFGGSTAVPEPGTLLLLGSGLLSVGFWGMRKKERRRG